jgi:voltage-gated potassium channel
MTDPYQSPTHPQAVLHPDANPLQRWLFKIIFGHHSSAGRAFDIVLLFAILASVVAVSLETVEPIAERYGRLLRGIEWAFTILFTIEYVVRLYCVREPARYARSFFGIVDLLAIIPTYLTLFAIPGVQSLLVVRGLRLLRVFRILKLVHLMREGAQLRRAIWESRDKIVVFLSVVMVIVTIVGAAMYLIESPVNDRFSSIPQSVYWAIVTMTTVGYGDVVPITALGKLLSATLIITGYALIVVPTGFVTATMIERKTASIVGTTTACRECGRAGHTPDATFCKYCGKPLAGDKA